MCNRNFFNSFEGESQIKCYKNNQHFVKSENEAEALSCQPCDNLACVNCNVTGQTTVKPGYSTLLNHSLLEGHHQKQRNVYECPMRNISCNGTGCTRA